MSLVSEHRGKERLVALASAMTALACLALLALAGQARAAENIYWNNYSAAPETIAFADITGSGGGTLNLGATPVDSPEGMAIDSATGRLYIAASENGAAKKGEIVFVNLDGSGAGVLATPGAEVNEPYGLAIDPVTRTIYWVNIAGGPGGKGSIGFAKLDGTGGGLLDTTGVTIESPYRLAVDPVGGKVFWGDSAGATSVVAFANLNNTGGGGILDITGATVPTNVRSLAVDSGAGRVYWLNGSADRISYASVNGGGGGDIDLTTAPYSNPYGLALDPVLGKLYWANWGNGATATDAIGFSALNGSGAGGITPLTAPVNGPQDPVILKSPSAAGAPTIARSAKVRAELSCSQGSWAADFGGGSVFQAPHTYAYQWSKNGAAIAGATAATLTATKPGSYGCSVTAANQAGSATQASAPVNVKAAKVQLKTKKKAKAKAGGVATFKIKATNQGDLKSKNARVCVKVPKKAAKDLKAKPKCKSLGKIKGKGKDSAKLRIKVGPNAAGTYKVTFQVKGSPGKAAKAKIVVG